MRILIIGSGGREHALAWKLHQSSIEKLYVAPGNEETRFFAQNIPIHPTNIERLTRFAKDNRINLTIVGPENPLALGIVDSFHSERLRIFGPTKAATQATEASKAFAKRFMAENHIPTAPFRIFRKYETALNYLRKCGAPIVVKASGLAAGKGAYPCETLIEAEHALKEIMVDRIHDKAGKKVVIEEFLEGQEVSIHAFCDGKTSILMPPSQDHKIITVGGKKLMTGGMGAYAPVPWVSDDLLYQIQQEIIKPMTKGLRESGQPFAGCLYPGLMITPQGPMVLEVNARFGDPETQVYMRLLKTDLLDIMEACIEGGLADIKIEWNSGFAVCVVLASDGYPGEYEVGIPISGLDKAERIPGIVIFHAGTTRDDTGQVVTAGGRVLGVTAVGETLETACARTYEAVKQIHFDGMHYQKDIGAKAFTF